MFGGVQTGAVWLRNWCAKAAGEDGAQADGSVALAVAQMIMSAKGDHEAGTQLYDLLGTGGIESIPEILSIRCVPTDPKRASQISLATCHACRSEDIGFS